MYRVLGCFGLIIIVLIGAGAFFWFDPLELGMRAALADLLDPDSATQVVAATPVSTDVAVAATTVAPIIAPTNTQPPPSPTPTPVPRRASLEIVSADFCSIPGASPAGLFSAQSFNASGGAHETTDGQEFPGTLPEEVDLPEQPPISEVLIRFTADSSAEDRNAFIAQIGTSDEMISELDTTLVTLIDGLTIEGIPDSPIVVSVEPHYMLGVAQLGGTPADPRFVEQWAFSVIGLPAAWSGLEANTEPVIVAVIDSGICADHPDLQGRLVPGFDFVERDDDPQDAYQHGCGVAGVIAANSNDIGIAGVAPNVQIMPLRVLDENGLGGYALISEAVIYAVDNGADIINMSLAGPFYSQIMDDAVKYALDAGVTIIGAAGNAGLEGAWYPAAFPGVIGVGSVDPSLGRSAFSNFGTDVDLFAPGSDILTTSTSGEYELTSGTSLAAPIVSGLAALAIAYNQPLYTSNTIISAYAPDGAPVCR